MVLKQAFNNKNILITGVTGFVGKVLFEKLLFAFHDIDAKKDYLYLTASKSKSSIVLAFNDSRKNTDHLFKNIFNNMSILCIIILKSQGDLIKPKLGLSIEDRLMLQQNLHYIINCAASINFQQRLDIAIKTNIHGPIRIIQLAKECKHLLTVTHMSTAYVNSDKSQKEIEQYIYQIPYDPIQQLHKIEAIPPQKIVQLTPIIINNFQNTYTYTKNLCQRILKQISKNLSLVIVRPSIIASSYSSPMPGWIDSYAAISGLIFMCSIGFVRHLTVNQQMIGDLIPVDFVVDYTIVATAHGANSHSLQIYHITSSHLNPITWKSIKFITMVYFKKYPPEQRLDRINISFHRYQNITKFFIMKQKLPIYIYEMLANKLGNKQMKNKAKKIKKNLNKTSSLQKSFRYFMTHQWIFKSQNIFKLLDFMNQQDKKNFPINIGSIDINHFQLIFQYGVHKYLLKQAVGQVPQKSLLEQPSRTYFTDIKWAMIQGKKTESPNIQQLNKMILFSQKVQKAIKKQSQYQVSKLNIPYEQAYKMKVNQSLHLMKTSFSNYKMSTIRFIAWLLHKMFRNIYQKLQINQRQISQIKQLQKKNIPFIFLPTHRSYIDFIVISYILFAKNLRCPYVATMDTLMNITLISLLLKQAGSFFFIRQNFSKSLIYKAIINQYIIKLIQMNNSLLFFLEQHRSRTGKTQNPKFQILQTLIQGVIESRFNDAFIIPVSINYQKVLEGQKFPLQLLGQEKQTESLFKIVKSVNLLNQNFGKVVVNFCKPFSLSQKIKSLSMTLKNNMSDEYKNLVSNSIGCQILYQLSQNCVIMSTSMISTILLMYRKGISETLLIQKVHWLAKKILEKGYKIGGINEFSPNFGVKNAINYLNNITKKTKYNVFELKISPGIQYQNILMLSYYRNNLIHLFVNQAFIAIPLLALGLQNAHLQGINIKKLEQQTLFFQDLLRKQFIKRITITPKNIQSFLSKMSDKGYIKIDKQTIKLEIYGDEYFLFLCSLLWPLIDSYWLTLIYLISLTGQGQRIFQQIYISRLKQELQWFAISMYDQKIIEHYQSCSLKYLTNAFIRYEEMQFFETNWKMITRFNKQKLIQMQVSISRFLKNTKSKHVNNQIQLVRKSILIDYPTLSKL